jgi:hypothetical protein
MEREDPRDTKSKEERLLPSLLKLLMDILLPKFEKSKSDRFPEIAFLLPVEEIENELPILKTALTDKELPSWQKSRTERESPRRAIDRRLIVDPRCKKSRIEQLFPSRVSLLFISPIDIADPTRRRDLNERELPKFTNCSADTALPLLIKLRKLKLLPKCR